MLKRSKRIQGKIRIAEILGEKPKGSNSFFILRKKENGLPFNRYAALIGKKLEKSSAKRNRKRRQIYEILRLLEKDELLPNIPPSDIVLIARSKVLTADFDELKASLTNLLRAS